MSEFNTDRYERLKAKIAEVCPDVLDGPWTTQIHSIVNGNTIFLEPTKKDYNITIAHVLRTLGHGKCITGGGEIFSYEKGNWLREYVGNDPVSSDLTCDLDGQTDDVKNWLSSIILKDE